MEFEVDNKFQLLWTTDQYSQKTYVLFVLISFSNTFELVIIEAPWNFAPLKAKSKYIAKKLPRRKNY